jgi:uncharacterized protein YaiI (UPF0178 family)
MGTFYVDGDACPVKAECYRVAKRYSWPVVVVANQWMSMPDDPTVRLEVVDDGFDAADDWIAERCAAGDIVITDDIPLAQRCLQRQSRVLTSRGEERDLDTIGSAMAMRELMQYVRDSGEGRTGPKPLLDKDRKRFLQELDKLVHAVRKFGA